MINELPESTDRPQAVRRVVIAPNRSMDWRQSLWFFGGISGVSLTIAGAFAAHGLWMILPFAGLELLALGICLYLVLDAGDRRQVVSVTPDRVRVEKGRLRRSGSRGGPESNSEFTRHWTRVRCVIGTGGRLRLWIGAGGEQVEIGEFLAEQEKMVLADKIRSLIAAGG